MYSDDFKEHEDPGREADSIISNMLSSLTPHIL